MGDYERISVAVWFVGILVIPLIIFLAGLGPDPLPNETIDPAPDLSIGRLFDSTMYAEISAWYQDQVPLRRPGVEWDAWIDLTVFNDSPSPSVILGEDDWLFFRPALRFSCHERNDPELVAETVRDVERILAAVGRKFVFVVAPDKASIYPEKLSAAARAVCRGDDTRTELRNAVVAEVETAIDLWTAFEDAKDDFEVPIFEPKDTHWTSAGWVLATQLIVDAVNPDLWDPAAVVIDRETVGNDTDLSVFIARPEPILQPAYLVERPGVVITTSEGESSLPTKTYETQGAVVTSRPVVVLHDSFGKRFVPDLRQYFATSVWLDWRAIERGANGPDRLTSFLTKGNTVVIEVVEREVYRRVPEVLGKSVARLVEVFFERLPSEPIVRESLLGTPEGEPVVISPPDPVTVSIPPGSASHSRFLVFEVFTAGTPRIGVVGGELREPRPNGLIAFKVGEGDTVDLQVRGGRVQVRKAFMITLDGIEGMPPVSEIASKGEPGLDGTVQQSLDLAAVLDEAWSFDGERLAFTGQAGWGRFPVGVNPDASIARSVVIEVETEGSSVVRVNRRIEGEPWGTDGVVSTNPLDAGSWTVELPLSGGGRIDEIAIQGGNYEIISVTVVDTRP